MVLELTVYLAAHGLEGTLQALARQLRDIPVGATKALEL
jgi:hypothetical protein